MNTSFTNISTLLLSQKTRTDIPIRGVIHIGACRCEEWEEYKKLNVEKVLWIEGNPSFVDAGTELLSATTNQKIMQAYLSQKNGTETFYLTEVDACNDSLMKPRDWYKTVAIKDSITVNVTRLDKFFQDYPFSRPTPNS